MDRRIQTYHDSTGFSRTAYKIAISRVQLSDTPQLAVPTSRSSVALYDTFSYCFFLARPVLFLLLSQLTTSNTLPISNISQQISN
jgi:hypothetical protein